MTGGYERCIVPGPGRYGGPGKVKIHKISFSVIKPKIISVSQQPV